MKKRELDISNYEEWMIDRLDGVLTSQEESVLDAFLLAHPELDDDLGAFESLHLVGDVLSHPDKEALKMPVDRDLLLISAFENGEDGSGLPAEDQKEFSLYQKTILRADERIIFPNKESLKKETTPVIPLWVKRIAIAASIIGVLMTLFIASGDEVTYAPRVAQSELPSFDQDLLDESFPSSREQLDQLATEMTPDEVPEETPEFIEPDPTPVPEFIADEPIEKGAVPQESLPTPIPELAPALEFVATPEELDAPEISHVNAPEEELSYEIPDPSEGTQDASTVAQSEKTNPITKPSSVVEYKSVLDVLKRATRESEVFALQDATEEAPYVETTLKVGNYGLAFKRKKKN